MSFLSMACLAGQHLLRIATNEIVSFCISSYAPDIIDHVKWLFSCKGGAKGRLSRYVEIFRNKKGFLLLYKTNSSCATFLFLPFFDVICDLLLNRRTATWNLFVKFLPRFDVICDLLLNRRTATWNLFVNSTKYISRYNICPHT